MLEGGGKYTINLPCVMVADSNNDKHHHTFYRTSTYWDHLDVGTPIQMASIDFTPNQLQMLVILTM